MSASLSTMTMAKNPKILHSGQLFIQNFLNRHAPVEVNKLSNGFKVATQEGGPNGYATVAVHSKSGGRFDTQATSGVSHLVQRAMWYGTQTKSATEVKAALDSIGGRVRFEQGREVQSVYIDCLGADSAKAVDLLADVTRNPKFDNASVEAARCEVLSVLKDDENSLPTQIFNNMYRNAYESTQFEAGSGLGLNPYGAGDVVKSATAEQLSRFHAQFSCPETMALVATGDVKTSTILEKAEQGFGNMSKVTVPATDKRYTGGAVRVDAGAPSAPYANHVAVGWEICGSNGADVLPLRLLTEVYGQYDRFMHDMTSNYWVRFNVDRQATQHGHMPLEEVRTFFDTFSDTGMMGFWYTFQVGAERAEGWNFLVALQNEWVKYCMRMEPYKVEVGKNLLKNKLVFEHDGAEKTNAEVGKQLISRGAYTPLEQAYARINDLTTQQVSDVINHYYYDREATMSSWGLYYILPVYYTTRRNMYKYRY